MCRGVYSIQNYAGVYRGRTICGGVLTHPQIISQKLPYQSPPTRTQTYTTCTAYCIGRGHLCKLYTLYTCGYVYRLYRLHTCIYYIIIVLVLLVVYNIIQYCIVYIVLYTSMYSYVYSICSLGYHGWKYNIYNLICQVKSYKIN